MSVSAVKSGAAVWRAIGSWTERGQAWLLLHKHALYGLSATRVLVGVAVLGLLLSNFPARHVLWGPGSFWAEPFRENSDFGALLGLYEGSGPLLFTAQYLVLIALTVAVILGWRTRLSTILLVIGLAALVERADTVGDQGDNIARIGLTFMVLMTTNAHWSLDARRRRLGQERGVRTLWERIWYGAPFLPGWFTTLLHNAALIALACQLFILYTASALFKVQGNLWQEGTALYYPLALHEYAVYPWLNALVYDNPYILTVATYFSVYVQLFFAVGLLHPLTRRLAILGVILLHGGIAVMMGLPWFSLAMLAFDAIFVTHRTWHWIERRLIGLAGKMKRRAGEPPSREDQEQVPHDGARRPSRRTQQQPV
ncbi:HTTM domain-containing protein [Nesterenkonia flava]|uniref:HTTM domain-containing protein n=1 Tax=Nesterenkonia flava TaxID=469799 RepID=A0ABU1FV92_9MICC|nr:HTTM domain-containing protein [Nesterenkonia flava]MDR5712587.1 HTTM domain-containing protein [Nesterenkonia flava]